MIEPGQCPWREWHGPEEKVVVGETVLGQFKDDNGKIRQQERRTEKIIRYADWEWRCRICYPRDT